MTDEEIKAQIIQWQESGKMPYSDMACFLGISKQHLNNVLKGHVPLCDKARKVYAAAIVFLNMFFEKYPMAKLSKQPYESRQAARHRKFKILKKLHSDFVEVYNKRKVK